MKSDTPRTDAYQYADYILNHYDRGSHEDKLCLAKSLIEHGYGRSTSKAEVERMKGVAYDAEIAQAEVEELATKYCEMEAACADHMAEVDRCKRDNGIIITAFALRNYKLKSEVERLKALPHFHHESYCRKCKEAR